MSSEMYASLAKQAKNLPRAEKISLMNVLDESLKNERAISKNSFEEKIKKIAEFKGCAKGFWTQDALQCQNSLRENRYVPNKIFVDTNPIIYFLNEQEPFASIFFSLAKKFIKENSELARCHFELTSPSFRACLGICYKTCGFFATCGGD